MLCFFFFQAEDGIRDYKVTGVQTCALPIFPQGHLLPAAIITGIFVTFLVVVYGGLIATKPPAGGDYVWQSRILGGGIAFVLAGARGGVILWHWGPIYGDILSVQFFAPILATAGRGGPAPAVFTPAR